MTALPEEMELSATIAVRSLGIYEHLGQEVGRGHAVRRKNKLNLDYKSSKVPTILMID